MAVVNDLDVFNATYAFEELLQIMFSGIIGKIAYIEPGGLYGEVLAFFTCSATFCRNGTSSLLVPGLLVAASITNIGLGGLFV